jgi:hypothetical protein
MSEYLETLRHRWIAARIAADNALRDGNLIRFANLNTRADNLRKQLEESKNEDG